LPEELERMHWYRKPFCARETAGRARVADLPITAVSPARRHS
jgi:hypothetical protein